MDREAYFGQEVPKEAVTALRTALGDRLVAVVLFGSRARREASPESDWDLLVIAEGLPEKLFDRLFFLKSLLPRGCRGAVSLLVKTPEEFESHLASLYLDMALDGQVLYDRGGYARDRLTALRRLIERVGLYREHTEAGDMWRWRKEPGGAWALEWER